MEYEQNNETKDINDSDHSWSSLSKRPSCKYELDSMDDEEDRTTSKD